MNLVNTLVGQFLTGVVFVMDYVQLQLDGSIITFSTNPSVISDDARLEFGDRDYRNALCELIGSQVSAISADPSGKIAIEFGDSRVEARREDESPETAVISFPEGQVIVV